MKNKYITGAAGDATTITTGTGKEDIFFHSLDVDHAQHKITVQVPMGAPVDWLYADELLVKYNTHKRVLRAYTFDGVKFNKTPVRILSAAGRIVMEEYFGVYENAKVTEKGLNLHRDYVQVNTLTNRGMERKEHDLSQNFIAQTLELGKLEMQASIDLHDDENIKEITITQGDCEMFKVYRNIDNVIIQTPFTG